MLCCEIGSREWITDLATGETWWAEAVGCDSRVRDARWSTAIVNDMGNA